VTIHFRRAGTDDLDALIDRDLQAFSGTFTAEERATWRELLDLDRFRVAYDGADLVGAAGSHELELTLPGGAVVPTGGTTWVSVSPTHRRRGIVTRLMSEVHADIEERGEPIAGLMASEGSIYERFGYGVATRCRVVEMDTRDAKVADPPDDVLRMVAPADHVDELWDRFDRHRSGSPGEVSRTRAWLAMRIAQLSQPFCAIHENGYALWTIDADWGEAEPAHTLRVMDLVASTPDASASLWNLVLSIDLVRTVAARPTVRLDDPLPYLLSDPRAVRTKAVHDFLWLRPNRVGELLAARRYRIDDELVIEVVDGDDVERWRLSGGPDGAVCDATDAEPDLTLGRAAMGSLLLGGVSATELAAGGRLNSLGIDLGRVDAFFGWSPSPHCTTSF
jgi:predicted acetyltransferase